MSQRSVQEVIAGVRDRLASELETQLAAILASHEQAVADARTASDADAERRWSAAVEGERAETQARIAEAVASVRVEADAERSRSAAGTRHIAGMLGELENARSLSDALSTARRLARTVAADAELFIVQPQGFEMWAAEGTNPDAAPGLHPRTLLDEASRTARTVRREDITVVPLPLEGTSVAVLAAHVDDAGSDMLQLIAAAAAARLGCLTAVRTLQATAWMSARERGPVSLDEAGSGGGDTSAQIDGDLGARRYARLLISEIKMYNEPLVRAGREHRDLSRRLSSEIERARQLYEARVPATLANRAQHFHEELVRTLADGDSTLLG